MKNKIYLNNEEELTSASNAGDKVFVEYRDKVEEIEEAKEYNNESWEFTLKMLKNVRFFKLN